MLVIIQMNTNAVLAKPWTVFLNKDVEMSEEFWERAEPVAADIDRLRIEGINHVSEEQCEEKQCVRKYLIEFLILVRLQIREYFIHALEYRFISICSNGIEFF